jgi:hypothetical protein
MNKLEGKLDIRLGILQRTIDLLASKY